MAHNTLHNAMSKANNFIPKKNSKTQQLKKEVELKNPKVKVVCSKCGKDNITLYKISKDNYLCVNCK